jgi:hypothetical protein
MLLPSEERVLCGPKDLCNRAYRGTAGRCIGPPLIQDDKQKDDNHDGDMFSLTFANHEFRLQPLVHFFGSAERRLHVIADVFLTDDISELALMD